MVPASNRYPGAIPDGCDQLTPRALVSGLPRLPGLGVALAAVSGRARRCPASRGRVFARRRSRSLAGLAELPILPVPGLRAWPSLACHVAELSGLAGLAGACVVIAQRAGLADSAYLRARGP
jgi:hypothetical protein